MKSPVSLVRAFFEDMKRLEPDVRGLDRDLKTIELRVKHEGLSFLTKTLTTLSDSLDTGLEEGLFTCPSAFKRHKGSLPALLQGLFVNVFDNHGVLLNHPSSTHVKLIREFCRMFRKYYVSDEELIGLERKTVEDFFEVDGNVSFNMDARQIHLLSSIAKMTLKKTSFDSYSENPVSRHGPGSTYETADENVKWEEISQSLSDPDSLLPLGFDSHYYGTKGPRKLPSAESRLICVPKTNLSLRTISIEGTLKQFIQQQLNGYLRHALSRCDILSHCLDLEDQTHNQKLAVTGSLYRTYSTIDLSKASDRLSIDLVTTALGHHESLLQWLMASRSSTLEYSDKVVTLVKYAGMGNATTFPVQSICYALICIAAMHDVDGKMPTYYSCRNSARSIRVYGDDLIVPTRYYTSVAKWLEDAGLKVNNLKSFHKGNFRESCGVDAFMGVDVTPTYVRSLPTKDDHSPSTLAACVSASNQFWLKGLYSAASCLAEMAGKYVYLPLVSAHSGLLGLHSRVDAMEAHSWDPSRQLLVTRGFTAVASKKKSPQISDRAKLLKCLISSFESRRDPMHLSKCVKRFNTRLRSSRVPTQVGSAEISE